MGLILPPDVAAKVLAASPARAGGPPPTPGPWVIDLPGHPPRVNSWRGAHWQKRHRQVKAFAQTLGLAAAAAGVPRVGPGYAPKRRLGVVLTGWPRGRVPDPDAFVKDLLDALKQSSLIVDDSQTWLAWTRPMLARGPRQTTRLTLEDTP